MFVKSLTALALAASAFVGVSAAPSSVAVAPREIQKRWPPGSVKPKVVVISMFSYEETPIISHFNLTVNLTLPGLSPLYPNVTCDESYDICHYTTGESEINAAASTMAFALNPILDLTESYFLIAGIAGGNPHCTGLGGVVLSRFAVQVALAYEVDARQKPENFTSGYYLQGTTAPGQVTDDIYGTEVFEMNTNLLNRTYHHIKDLTLNDSTTAAAYRATFPSDWPVAQPPFVGLGDVSTSDVYFYGSLLSEAFGNITKLWTNGEGNYCSTAQEDNATLESLIRAQRAGLVDVSRLILMRTISDIDRAPPGVDETVAFNADQGGFEPSIQNIEIAGAAIVDMILDNWDSEFAAGIAPQANWTLTADDLDSLDIPVTYTTRKRSLQARGTNLRRSAPIRK